MVSTIQATQAREGILTTVEQADRAYTVVREGEKAAFFDLDRFKPGKNTGDRRHEVFVSTLRGSGRSVRFDVARRDFQKIDGSPLAYRELAIAGPLFRGLPALVPTFGRTRSGLNTTEIERFVRNWWEVDPNGRKWVLFAKGGDFSRFYADWHLVFDWEDNGRAFKRVVAEKYGSATRFVKSEEDYFKEGISWIQTTVLGINARPLPARGIFGVASPTMFPNVESDRNFLLGVMNSTMFDFLAQTVATRNWGATAVGLIPVPNPSVEGKAGIAEMASEINAAKADWDQGNEASTAFRRVWLQRPDLTKERTTLKDQLDALAEVESSVNQRISFIYAALNDDVYRLYGIDDNARREIEDILGPRPKEVVWPQMEGKTLDQKRMDHVWRLLSYAVKRVMEGDEDGLVPLLQVAGEAPLLDRVHTELGKMFATRDVNEVEVEIVNELKRKVKAYDRADSIRQWLEDNYFAYHTSLYKNRPIFWHISSRQGRGPAAFSALVHYHRFDKDRLAKLRGVYLREALGVFRREAALAGQQGRAEDRVEWQAKVEEAEELDRRLQHLQEGFHHGTEDYRILTPWKAEKSRPKVWDPDINDGVKVNIEPLQRAGVLRIPEVV
jgi:hypothetical protein